MSSKEGPSKPARNTFSDHGQITQTFPIDDPVYAFMDKKRSKGKPYYVYMTASANKFFRIYYGEIRKYFASLEESKEN